MFEKLQQSLQAQNARFRVIVHSAEGGSARVAELRGTAPGQGAKAMLCRVKELPELFVLAVLPGDRKVDFRKVGQAVGGKKAALAAPDQASALTGCVMGAVPPFSFWSNVRLVVDPTLLDANEEIAFNAGALDRSIVMNAADYQRIAAPLIVDIVAN